MTPIEVSLVDLHSENPSVGFVESLRKTGFAVVENHPIDMNLVNQVYSLWSDFFNSTDKHNYLFHFCQSKSTTI